jgi:hypothetical protein
MARLTINTGSSANDRTGDNLKTAFDKVNANFTELYATSSVSFPSQTGNAGKYLTTDGHTLSWHTVTIPTDISQLSDTTHLLQSAPITASATAPISHSNGTLWYDETSGRLYVYYDGGWVDASPRGVGIATSIGQGTKLSNDTGTAGQISFDTNYVYICTATNTWKRSPLVGGY